MCTRDACVTTIRTHSTHTHIYTGFSHTLHVSTLIECSVDACMIGTGTLSAATIWFDDGQLHVYQCLGILWATLHIFGGNFQQFLAHFWVIFVQFVGQFGLFWGMFWENSEKSTQNACHETGYIYPVSWQTVPRNWIHLSSFLAKGRQSQETG